MTAIAKNNIAYTACNDIKVLLGDSFRSLELVNFFYARHYNDGKCYLMTTIPEVIDFDLQNDIQFVPSISSDMLSSKFHYLMPYDGIYSELISKFNTWHPINIIFREKGYFDVFCFTSLRNDNEQVNRHLNNLSLTSAYPSLAPAPAT